MKPTLAALGCIVALTGATAFAQQQQPREAPTVTEKVKEAAKAIDEKTKETAQKIKEKTQQAAHDARTSDDSKSTGAAQMQRKADAELRAARAKCGAMEDKAQKSVCLKQATAAHANAEVKIEKARAASHGSTATMGAGKASQ